MRTHVVAVALALCSLPALRASAEPWDKPGYALTFHDEFEGASLDGAAWGTRYKWGEAIINGELQAYVDDAFTLEDGLLRITATHAPGTYAGESLEYRSGLVASAHEQIYGYFEISCRMPAGQGYWPAFWLLGAPGTPGVNEIDIHEFLGHDVDTIYATVHWGTDYGDGHESDGSTFTGPDFTADFHTFAVEWEPTTITWLVDGAPIFQHTGDGVPEVPMYLIANLAVGGTWPGAPDGTTVFPGHYEVDYIRAYRRDLDAGVGGSNQEDSGSGGAGGAGGGPSTGGIAPDGGGAASATSGSSALPASDRGCGCRTTSSREVSGGWACLAFLAAAVRRTGRRGSCSICSTARRSERGTFAW
jgi:beta-glucanase (GH16 family)